MEIKKRQISTKISYNKNFKNIVTSAQIIQIITHKNLFINVNEALLYVLNHKTMPVY